MEKLFIKNFNQAKNEKRRRWIRNGKKLYNNKPILDGVNTGKWKKCCIYAVNARSECSLGVQIPAKLAQGELMKEEMLRFSTNLKRKKGNVVDLTTSFFYSSSFSVLCLPPPST